MIADCAVRIGASHQVCQDYARYDKGVVVLADGCSSSPDTDIGARILALSALERTKHPPVEGIDPDPTSIIGSMMPYDDIARKALDLAMELSLPSTSIDATLLMMAADETSVACGMWGDGLFVVKRESGKMQAWEVRYPAGYPSYPSYLLDMDREMARRKANEAVLVSYEIDAPVQGPNGSTGHVSSQEDPHASPLFYKRVPRHGDDPIKAAAIFTDGANSFMEQRVEETSKRNIPVPFVDFLLPEVMAFRGRGEFARRRLQGLFRANPNLSHYDDLSVGAILL